MHRWRRVTQITEVRKHWNKDPADEGGFVDLMKYDAKTDELVPTEDLINGDSDILKSIASNVKDWAGDWDAVWDNVMVRAKIKQTLLDVAVKTNNMNLIEAEFVIHSNDQFHKICDDVKEELGSLDTEKIYFEWNEWFKRHVKRIGLR